MNSSGKNRIAVEYEGPCQSRWAAWWLRNSDGDVRPLGDTCLSLRTEPSEGELVFSLRDLSKSGKLRPGHGLNGIGYDARVWSDYSSSYLEKSGRGILLLQVLIEIPS